MSRRARDHERGRRGGQSAPPFPLESSIASAGDALELYALSEAGDLEAIISNVRWDAARGRLTAELSVRNTGTPSSRAVAVLLTRLGESAALANASGASADGVPYVNLRPAIPAGGLRAGKTSAPVLIEIDNPSGAGIELTTRVLAGALSVLPGERLEVPLPGTDADGDPVRYTISSAGPLPTGGIIGQGLLVFTPRPGQEGVYEFTLIARDGALETRLPVSLTVEADTETTTRVSGYVLTTAGDPVPDVPVILDNSQTRTDADGSYLFETDGALTSDTIVVHGQALQGQSLPFFAQSIEKLLGHEVYVGSLNVVPRPVYLPHIDAESGSQISTEDDVTVTTPKIPGAAVEVPAGSLIDQGGRPFTGVLSITEVPPDLTPAALPDELMPDIVVAVQPGEMSFTQPVRISLPNRAGREPGTLLDLWSIDPSSGDFEKVGVGRVSEDGSVVETIEGGMRNTSWHLFVPPEPEPEFGEPDDDPFNPDDACPDDCAAEEDFSSVVELHSGAVVETHQLPTYSSLGKTRGVQLVYDSLGAHPRPIMHIAYSRVVTGRYMVANLDMRRGEFFQRLPGYSSAGAGLLLGSEFPLSTVYESREGDHVWRVDAGGAVRIALQADLRDQPTGIYEYAMSVGIRQPTPRVTGAGTDIWGISGTRRDLSGERAVVNEFESAIGAGWGIAGVQRLVEDPNGSLLLVDGAGWEMIFGAPVESEEPEDEADVEAGDIVPLGAAGPLTYVSPPEDFSALEKLPDGTYRRTTKGQTVSLFDAEGRRTSVTDRSGNEVRYEYDEANRLAKEVWLDEDGDEVESIEYTWDKAGNVLTASDSKSSLTFTYDARNRGATVTATGGPAVTLRYGYDAEGNVLSVSDSIGGADGGLVEYVVGALDRVTRISQSGAGVSEKRVDLSYTSLGTIATIERFADLAGAQPVVTTTYAYDELARPERTAHASAAGELAFYEFAYDSADRITSIADVDGTATYAYDDTSQVTGVDHSDSRADESYAYDDNGNRTASHLADGYTTGEANRLISDGRFAYLYDAEGNLVRRFDSETGERRDFEYDHRGRLVTIHDLEDEDDLIQAVSFTYDVFDRRIAIDVDGSVTRFVYAGDDVALELEGGDELTVRYLHGPNADQVLAQEAVLTGEVLWHLTDHLGTVRDLVDASGAVVNHIRYDTFGNITAQSDASRSSRYLYAGRELDAATGLYFMRARYYDASVGRFLSEDPVGFAAGDTNPYRYAFNRATALRDSSGRDVYIFDEGIHRGIGVPLSDGSIARFDSRCGGYPGADEAGFGDVLACTFDADVTIDQQIYDSLQDAYMGEGDIIQVELDDAHTQAALEFLQDSYANQETGEYDLFFNSCRDLVTDAIQAGDRFTIPHGLLDEAALWFQTTQTIDPSTL